MTKWILIAVAAAVLAWIVYGYNRLIRLRQLAFEGWSGIDVQLKRRADLIPNLVDAVKAYASHERTLFEHVASLRNDTLSGKTIGEQVLTGEAMGAALSRIIALAEAYPELKADANFRELQRQLAEIEEELQFARRYYNGTVRNLNAAIQTVPSNLVANAFGFKEADYFQLEDRNTEAQAPQVKFEQ